MKAFDEAPRALRSQGKDSAAVIVPVVKTVALFVNGGQTIYR
jgi:hypothetical protein